MCICFFGHHRLVSVGQNDKHLSFYGELCLTGLWWNADFCPFLHRTYAHYCSATYNLQHNFPSVVPSQLQSAEEECAICKEHMKVCLWLMCPCNPRPLTAASSGSSGICPHVAAACSCCKQCCMCFVASKHTLSGVPHHTLQYTTSLLPASAREAARPALLVQKGLFSRKALLGTTPKPNVSTQHITSIQQL